MKIEIDKEDFVRLATYASCADLPEEEKKCGVTLGKVMDSLDKDIANDIASNMLALRARIEILNGANVEDGGDDEMETSSKKHKVEKIMSQVLICV